MTPAALTRISRCLAGATVATAVWVGGLASWSTPAVEPVTKDQRVVAVGDVHGSFDGLTTILREADLIDQDNRWIGGTATLVQIGDLLDRGVLLQEVMDLLITLQDEADHVGGQVIVVLGNHETMNLLGITRDVNRDAFEAFADDRSEQRRKDGWSAYKSFWKKRMPEIGHEPAFSKESKDQWMVMHPPGFFEYVDAIGPDGRYGSWLRARPAAAIVGDTLFIHGGYGPFLEGKSVEEINSQVANELATFDRTRSWMVAEGLALPWYSIQELTREAQRELSWIAGQNPTAVSAGRLQRAKKLELQWNSWYLNHPEGPFWYREAAKWTDDEHGALVEALLNGLGVVRQVVGHTPQRTARIQARVGGRVFLIDTGMLSTVYGGRPSALEIVGDTITAIYPGEREVLQAPPAHQ